MTNGPGDLFSSAHKYLVGCTRLNLEARPLCSPHSRTSILLYMHDFFISHATEDKDEVARPLADTLTRYGYDVWFDEYVLRLGDSLREAIDRGLHSCRYGVLVLSPAFFRKRWPREELDALFTLSASQEGKRLLPIWHNVTAVDVAQFSPLLASRYAVSTAEGLPTVIGKILQVVREGESIVERHPHTTRAAKKRFVVELSQRRYGPTPLGGFLYSFEPLRIVNLSRDHAILEVVLKASITGTRYYSQSIHKVTVPGGSFVEQQLTFEFSERVVQAVGGPQVFRDAAYILRLTDAVRNEFESHGLEH